MCISRAIPPKGLPHRKMQIEKIRILSFNVENLAPKLEDPFFVKLMNDHDICLFSETWLKSNTKFHLDNFWEFHQVREKTFKRGRHSGGVSIFAKKQSEQASKC